MTCCLETPLIFTLLVLLMWLLSAHKTSNLIWETLVSGMTNKNIPLVLTVSPQVDLEQVPDCDLWLFWPKFTCQLNMVIQWSYLCLFPVRDRQLTNTFPFSPLK